MSMYARKEEPSAAQPSEYRRKRAIRLSCEILGISEHASMNEIKKAYRTLVKIHHPDRFMNESMEQQDLAEERFIKVQKAYELLEQYR